jgi:8-oxo-dGTP pyrophosphatase MutT (NUDIX family)
MTADTAQEIVRVPRPAARILLTDAAGRVLMFRFSPDDRPPFWCTPGGAVDPGESYEQAARRELLEETGIHAEPGPEIARRVVEFLTLEGLPVIAEERYFRVRVADPEIDTSRHTPLEQRVMREWRWFARDEIAGFAEPLFPDDLTEMLSL